MNSTPRKLSSAAIILALLASIWISYSLRIWKRENRVLVWDVMEYYSYLPATFIHHDLTFRFTENSPDEVRKHFWVHTAPNGGKYIKMTMGMSVLYAPFFLMAWAIESFFSSGPVYGFSTTFKFFMMLGSWTYLLLGLFFLRAVLLRYFNDLVTAITLFSLVVGTNLLFYSSIEACMSHAYNFSLFAIFLWLTIRYYEKPSTARLAAIGLLAGLISLIRPSNSIILLVFFGWGITSISDLKKRISFFLSKTPSLLLMGVCILLVWFPQMVFWKINTGHWMFYTYGDEGFFFSRPALLKGLFSWRKGWLLYTPMMALALTGFIFLKKRIPQAFLPLLIFTFANIWIITSWWSWWYGGGLGMRPMIDSYALLAFPLAAFISGLLEKKKSVKIAGLALIFLLNFHSVFQTFQYYYGAIHWDSMSRKAYFSSFGHLHPQAGFKEMLDPPDYAAAKKGLR